MPVFSDIKTWTDRLGRSGLRTFTDKDHHFWLEQNPAKRSKCAKLAREGHAMFDLAGFIRTRLENAGGYGWRQQAL